MLAGCIFRLRKLRFKENPTINIMGIGTNSFKFTYIFWTSFFFFSPPWIMFHLLPPISEYFQSIYWTASLCNSHLTATSVQKSSVLLACLLELLLKKKTWGVFWEDQESPLLQLFLKSITFRILILFFGVLLTMNNFCPPSGTCSNSCHFV